MKKYRGMAGLTLCAALLCLMLTALGESARVVTRGGQLNMRKAPDDKAALVDTVPNKALVEAVEIGEKWTKIIYKRQSGYVKTEYLKLATQLEGKTVYADGDILMMREEPREDARLMRPISAVEPVHVISVADGWALAECGGAEGYVPTVGLSYQWEQPAGTVAWIHERGTVTQDCPLLKEPKEASGTEGALTAGQDVAVTLLEKEWCLAVSDAGCGYIPAALVVLSGPVDGEIAAGEGIQPMEAAVKAEEALRKKFRAFAKEPLYCVPAIYAESGAQGGLYHCGFFNGQDQYLFGALVDAETGKTVCLASYTGFAAPVRTVDLLPAGEIKLNASGENLSVGDVWQVTVSAWTEHACRYALSRDGAAMEVSEDTGHFRAAFRPREAGTYEVTVTVTDENGRTESASCSFSVSDQVNGEITFPSVYSQKDGWWADKQYRHSNLQKSGCAIFTLSTALQRMGHTESGILPENLAADYARCLIRGEGTSNELLIKLASKAFGFKTRPALYTDQKEIVNLLQNGAMFTFSIARGHIALVTGLSPDGTMAMVADSAPGATYERIVNCGMYYPMRSGVYRAALSVDELPGALWYFETGEYGGLEYYLPVSYLARRGVRLIQPVAEDAQEEVNGP